MKKRLLSMALGTMMVLSTLAGCGSKDGGSAAVNTKPEEQGKVLNIYCWNEEFKLSLIHISNIYIGRLYLSYRYLIP